MDQGLCFGSRHSAGSLSATGINSAGARRAGGPIQKRNDILAGSCCLEISAGNSERTAFGKCIGLKKHFILTQSSSGYQCTLAFAFAKTDAMR